MLFEALFIIKVSKWLKSMEGDPPFKVKTASPKLENSEKQQKSSEKEHNKVEFGEVSYSYELLNYVEPHLAFDSFHFTERGTGGVLCENFRPDPSFYGHTKYCGEWGNENTSWFARNQHKSSVVELGESQFCARIEE